MASPKSSHQVVAQAETLLIYGIFLFLTGLAQIAVTIAYQYVIAKNNYQPKIDSITLATFLPKSFSLNELHLWYIYPSATWTLIPCFFCMVFAICKRRVMAILICISSLISFVTSSVYIGLLIIHTLDYWQTISSNRSKTLLLTTTTTSPIRLLVPMDEPVTFVNLALLITFTLALVQALLSMIGAVISCLWSPCCLFASSHYTPILTNSHYAQTTPHRFENPQTATLRSIKRQQQETHRFISAHDSHEPVMNGFLHKTPPIRSNYDDV